MTLLAKNTDHFNFGHKSPEFLSIRNFKHLKYLQHSIKIKVAPKLLVLCKRRTLAEAQLEMRNGFMEFVYFFFAEFVQP